MSNYISREAAIELLHYNADERCSAVVSDFEEIPAADVEPVRYGNWNIRLADEMTLCLECSICGRKVDNIDLHHLLEAGEYGEACRRYPYCHCGAKMCLEDNDES
jgi:hypothetical protein|nr:MAG TPA: DNA REPAIR HELICASE RAD25, SSL2, PRE-INITIATION COMPLEX, RNA POLYMERASE.0A [Caudoviricetes sp.]DAH09890.1 MAG TPA: DNA REPAIR HELICASE RAD25, SSL2, PRE-INITIATION COMPLEX, RNA polymerase.0A [Caudoviricetes sp.]